VAVGDPCYDYYSMKPGKITKFDSGPREDSYHDPLMQGSLTPWFTFEHNDGTREYLNGQRICSLDQARRKGWPGAS